MSWKVSDVKIGDYIKIQIIHKEGDRNLDGFIIAGIVKELDPEYKMVKLESGWCCHEQDELLEHNSVA